MKKELVLSAAAIAAACVLVFSPSGGCTCSEDSGIDAGRDAGKPDATVPDAGDAGETDGSDVDGGIKPDGGQCFYYPTQDFDPKKKWAWEGSTVLPSFNEVIALPVVMDMTDDNGDGKVDQNDIPDIAFISFNVSTALVQNTGGGRLRVISGNGMGEICTVTDVALAHEAGMAGYIDQAGIPTIIAVKQNHLEGFGLLPSRPVAFQVIPVKDKDGKITGYSCTQKWEGKQDEKVDSGWGGPALADINKDGDP
ncbi:MAG: hypothetical protein WC889_15655, partial [Myxococcota bacterium]